MIKDHQIPFSAPMVMAILDGRKTMTRRILKNQPVMLPDFNHGGLSICIGGSKYQVFCPSVTALSCPYGKVGDRLWVRENYRFSSAHDGIKPSLVPVGDAVEYFADTTARHYLDGKQRPSIFMPRWASRITLEITGVRVERLRDISEDDAKAEGPQPSIVGADLDHLRYRAGFQTLWGSINGAGSWEANPWCWVISFKRV